MYLKKELYELIRTDEKIFDFIQESSLDGLWYWDLENPENEWMSPKFWTVLGYEPDEMPHKSSAWQNIINQEDLKTALDNFTKHCENPNYPYDQIVRYKHKNGSTVWIRCRGLAIRERNGKPIRMLGAHQDITENMLSSESNKALAEMLDVAPSSITVHNTEGKFLFANQKTFEIHGYSPSEFLAVNLHDLDVPESEALLAERFELIAKQGYATFEVKHYRKDKTTFPLEVFAKTVNWQGEPAVLSIASDITERKNHEKEFLLEKERAEKSEAFYRQTFEEAPVGIAHVAPDGHFIKVNKLFCEITGYSKEELLKINIADITYPDDLKKEEVLIKKVLNNEIDTFSIEKRYIHKKGHIIWVGLHSSVVRDNNKVLFAIATITDISKRIELQEELIAAKERAELNEQKYRIVFDKSLVSILIADDKGYYLSANNAACNLLGYSYEELMKMNVSNLKTIAKPDANERYLKYIENGEETGEFDFITKSGENKIAKYLAVRIKTDFNLSMLIDITEQKKSEIELLKAKEKVEESEQLFKSLIENAPDGVVIIDASGRFKYGSPNASRHFGYDENEIIGHSGDEFTHPDDLPFVINTFVTILNNPAQKPKIKYRFKRKNGEYRWIETTFTNLLSNKAINGIILNYTDITESKQLFEELVRTKENAEKSQQKFKAIADTSPLAIYISKGMRQVAEYINPKFYKLFGYNYDEVSEVALWWVLAYPDKDYQKNVSEEWNSRVESAIQNKTDIEPMETIVTCKNGDKKNILWGFVSTGDENWAFGIDLTLYRKTGAELIAAKEKVEESEERFNLAMKASNDGLFDWNLETNEIYYSPGWKKMLGYEDNELPNDFSVWENNTEPDDVKKSWELQQKLIARQTDRFVNEFKMKHKDGHWVDILARAEAFFNECGKAVRIVGTHTDITERKRAAILIKEYASRLELTMEAANMAWWEMDIRSGNVTFSRKKTDMLGYSADKFHHYKDFTKLVHHDDFEPMMDSMRAILKGTKDKYDIEYRIKTQSGEFIWFHDVGTISEKTQNGEPLTVSGIVLNINERKLTEEQINQERLFNEMLIESLPGIFYMFDSNFAPLKWNRNKAELLGLSDEEMKTHNTLDYIATRDKEKVIETFKKTFYEGASHEVIHIINHEGKEFAYHLTGKRLDTPNGPVLLGVGIDVSDRIKAENELVTALNKAEESDKLKTAFLQNMSHEIRTPLNGILGFSKLLQESNIDENEIKEYTGIISQSGQRLLEIINNILDISKIETGQMVVHNESFSLNSMISQLFSFFSPFAEAKKIKLYYKSSLDNYNSQIVTDETKLNQILTNLINNAIKFTFKGSIDFGYKFVNEELLFYVKDTGIGIPSEFHNRIFERFTQIDLKITHGFEGAGLGLAISKGLVEMLGGRMWFESEFGKGTSFFFTIPYFPSVTEVNESREIDDEMKFTKKIKILIAEDDYNSFIYLSKVLKNSDFILIQVENGQMAVDYVKNNPDINLVLMDIRMPVMNGIEATKQIKSIKPNLPIIAQTAYAFREEKEMILAIGCDEYLSKPIDSEKLLKLIKKYIE